MRRWGAANPGELLKTQMKPEAYLDALGTPSPPQKDHFDIEPYQKYFTSQKPDLLGHTTIGVALGLKIRFKDGPTTPQDEAFNKIVFACDRLDEETFEAACLKGFKIGIKKFCRSSNDAWGVIAELLSRELEKKERLTAPSPQKTVPQTTRKKKKKFESRRGEAWKSHSSEKKLWRSSKASFDHLLYRAQVPKDPEKFPWCQVGIESLKKYTGYSHCQITRALAQLQRFKRIKRIVKGNEYQGASKYLVFFNLEMSRAHSWKSRHAQKD